MESSLGFFSSYAYEAVHHTHFDMGSSSSTMYIFELTLFFSEKTKRRTPVGMRLFVMNKITPR